MNDPSPNDRLRELPAVDRVVDRLSDVNDRGAATAAARRAIDAARADIRRGEDAPPLDRVVDAARTILDEQVRLELQPVINATGVLIHTNLGRVPLSREQLDAVIDVASGYSNLEYDLVAGRRGDRYSHARALLTRLTGADSALVVNNNAAAVLLVLACLCADREVIVSRGELIEIGGEFRVPDVMAASGAHLVEVGTTNRTHIADYERAIGPDSGAILKVHPSNYRVVGFTASVSARELARLALGHKVYFIHDLGSGLVAVPGAPWEADEPDVRGGLEDGADIVTFSGDKLLGGPQAGIILGRAHLIDRIAKHPLLRAVRVDKMTLAALEATIRIYLEERADALPFWRMAAGRDLEGRAAALAARLGEALGPAAKVEAVATRAVAGGGSLPGTEVGSWGVAIEHPERSAAELERALRHGRPAVIGRIEDGRLVLDLRTVPPEGDDELGYVVGQAITG